MSNKGGEAPALQAFCHKDLAAKREQIAWQANFEILTFGDLSIIFDPMPLRP